jgi:hypothetical protein
MPCRHLGVDVKAKQATRKKKEHLVQPSTMMMEGISSSETSETFDQTFHEIVLLLAVVVRTTNPKQQTQVLQLFFERVKNIITCRGA